MYGNRLSTTGGEPGRAYACARLCTRPGCPPSLSSGFHVAKIDIEYIPGAENVTFVWRWFLIELEHG